MKKLNGLKYAEITLLILVWVVLLAAPLMFRNDDYFEWRDIFKPLETIVPLFIIFLINRFLLVPFLLFKNKSLYYLASVAGLILVFTVGSFFITKEANNRRPPPDIKMQVRKPLPDQRRSENQFLPPDEQNRRRPIPPYGNLLVFSFLMIGFDTGLRVSFRLSKTEKEKATLEMENIGTQLAFLRNQVSPHFFMNTLNNIHSLIDIDQGEAKESIIRLSKLMRHLLYDSEIDKIPIQKEIDFITNYVDLMKLRYSEKVKINLLLPSVLPDKSIPPLLFTSYIENAFKHGVSYQTDSFIVIAVLCKPDKLIFEVKNSKAPRDVEDESRGIGIENSRKRLDLIYGKDYSLDIKDLAESYEVKLSIPL